MNKNLLTKKNGMILRIAMLAIICLGLFACSNTTESFNVKKEIENMYKLEEQGNNTEAKKIYHSLMEEVDKLRKAGKKEKAKELFETIMDEINVREKMKKEMRQLEKEKEKEKEKADVSTEKKKSEEFDWWSNMNPFPERAKKKEKQENAEKNNE